MNRLIVSRKVPPGIPTQKIVQGLREDLIWHTMISMLRALNYLHAGGVGLDRGNQDPDWQPIVHNSVNPANIFFKHPNAKEDHETPAYGPCMLGNFRRCVILPTILETDDVDEDEISDRREAFEHLRSVHEEQETGYEAPELLLENTNHVPGPASDLWSLGAVMVAVMTGRTIWDLVIETHYLHQVRRRRHQSQVTEKWQNVALIQRLEMLRRPGGRASVVTHLPERYSWGLRRLVAGMLAIDPLDRGDAVDVLVDAEAGFAERQKEQGEEDDDGSGYEEVMRAYHEAAGKARGFLGGG